MSVERRSPMGLQHVTVVPENFEPDATTDGSGIAESDRHPDPESDPSVPRHR